MRELKESVASLRLLRENEIENSNDFYTVKTGTQC